MLSAFTTQRVVSDKLDSKLVSVLPLLFGAVIVKASSGPRYVVGCRTKVDKTKLKAGARVALDMTTLTIMRALPREVKALHDFAC